MKKWEYNTVELIISWEESIDSKLDQFGSEGWELASGQCIDEDTERKVFRFIFKRPNREE